MSDVLCSTEPPADILEHIGLLLPYIYEQQQSGARLLWRNACFGDIPKLEFPDRSFIPFDPDYFRRMLLSGGWLKHHNFEEYADIYTLSDQALRYPTRIYADGGLIASNPSTIAGTYAWVHVAVDDTCLNQGSAVITPKQAGCAEIGNNLTEMLAVLAAFRDAPQGWSGTLCSDSAKALQWLFQTNVPGSFPDWLHASVFAMRAHVTMSGVRTVLHSGHPTREQLESGVGKGGKPVSKWNVLCDTLCRAAGNKYLEEIEPYAT